MTTSSQHRATRETAIEADQRVPLVRITRDFDAPVEKLFRAHSDSDLFASWIGPNSMRTDVRAWDCRTGGSYRFVMTRADHTAEFYGGFHEVRRNELIVQTFAWAEMPDHIALEKLHFVDLGDGRSRLMSTSLCDSFEDRDAMIASGMESGINEGYVKLDELVARL